MRIIENALTVPLPLINKRINMMAETTVPPKTNKFPNVRADISQLNTPIVRVP
jgi:hypothetical protein